MNKTTAHTLRHNGQRRLTLDGMSLRSRFLRTRAGSDTAAKLPDRHH